MKTDAKFEKWKGVFDSYLNEEIEELQEDYLDALGLRISIDQSYAFSGRKSHWLAVYERSSGQILDGVIAIGVNYPNMYAEMQKRGIDEDDFNIEAQARITVGHEIGHGIVDYIKQQTFTKEILKECPNLKFVSRCGAKTEESVVEEFGEYQFPEATGCYESTLCDALDELSGIN